MALYVDKLIKKSEKQKAKYENGVEYENTYIDLLLSSLDTFQWEGLPDTCNERMLELSLNVNGSALIAKVNGSLLTLIASPDGSLNVYGDPVGAWGTGFNGFNQHFNLYVDGGVNTLPINTTDGEINAVLCLDNKLMYPFNNFLKQSAWRIADSQRSIDVIARMLKSPTMITCEEKYVETVKKILEDTSINTPFILGMGGLPYDTFQVLDTGANPESLKTLQDYRENLISQIREKMGISNNPEADKQERLLVDEVNVNNKQTELSVSARLKERQKFAERCNKFFGTNISVSCANLENDEETDYNEKEDGENDDRNNTEEN